MSHSAPTQLSRRQKAAAIVQLLVEQQQAPDLSRLPESAQATLTETLGAIGWISRTELEDVITEFTQEVENIGLTVPGSRDDAITALADHLSPHLAESFRKELSAVRNGDHWPIITALDEGRLAQIMQHESIEVAAVALSKLPASKAALVLTQISGERARAITYAMSLTADIAPQTVHHIGIALAQDYGNDAARAFDKAPVQRLGAILNATQTDTREDVLVGLEAEDQPFASEVRKAIFTFKDIAPRVKASDVPNCIRSVDGNVLSTALAAAMAADEALQASAEFILNSLSQRMAGQLRDDAADRGKVKKDEAEAAMAEVTKAIREMVEGGVITLIDPDAEDQEDAA